MSGPPLGQARAPVPGNAARRFGPGRIVAAILAGLLALIGVAAAGGGAAVLIANGLLRDDEGFFTSRQETFTTRTPAITTESLDITTAGPVDVLETTGFATVRIRASGPAGRRIFVGIARTTDVARYLAGVAHDEIADIDYDPFRVRYRSVAGGDRVADPGVQTFWVARAVGAGGQTLRWPVRDGDWSVVAMNADAAPGVTVRADAGVKVRHVVAIGVGFLIGGLVLLGIGLTTLLLATRRGRPAAGDARIGGASVPPTHDGAGS